MEAFILYTVRCSLCLAAGYLLYILLLRRETFHRIKRFVLLAVIIASALMPLVKIRVDRPVSSPARLIQGPVITMEANTPAYGQPLQQAAPQGPGRVSPGLPAIVYLAGAFLQLVLVLWSLARILIFLRRSRKTRSHGSRLAVVPGPLVPFCFGRRIFISEEDLASNGPAIIRHEQAHLAGYHGFDLLLAEFCLVATWYNPFSWLIRHELKQNHEFEADRQVLRQGTDEQEYQLLLVRAAAGERRFMMASQFRQHAIKNRIQMMEKQRSAPGALLKLLLFVPLMALMGVVVAQREIKTVIHTVKGTGGGKYLQVKPDQLPGLGFVTAPSGLFYKNTRNRDSKTSVLCLAFTEKEYSESIILHTGEEVPGRSAINRTLKKQALTTFDFYPVVVASFSGHRTLDMSGGEKDPAMVLLPVQVDMAGMNLGKRADTLVFWFKPTPALKALFAPLANTDEYLRPCPPDPAY